MARYGARILAYGTIADTEGTFPFYELYMKELVADERRARPWRSDFPVAIEAVPSGTRALRRARDAIASRCDHVADAFSDGGPREALKVVVEI